MGDRKVYLLALANRVQAGETGPTIDAEIASVKADHESARIAIDVGSGAFRPNDYLAAVLRAIAEKEQTNA